MFGNVSWKVTANSTPKMSGEGLATSTWWPRLGGLGHQVSPLTAPCGLLHVGLARTSSALP